MLKGTTKIELTDVNTGETQVIEKHNTITGALQELFNPVLGHLTDVTKLAANIPAYSSLLGGLLLFDGRIEGDPLPVYAPDTVKLVGCARYNIASTQGSKYAGSYDANESLFSDTDKTAKFVYNFTQAQANGTIGSVCLTHRTGGYGVYAGDVSARSVAKLGQSIYATPTVKLLRGADRFSYIRSFSDTTEHLYAIDVDNDLAYYFKVPNATTIIMLKRTAGLKHYSMFGNNNVIVGEPVTITLTTPLRVNTSSDYYNSFNFDTETNTLHIVSMPSTGSSNYITVGSQFTVTSIRNGETTVTQKTLTNLHTSSLVAGATCVYRGKVYLSTTSSSVTINGRSAYKYIVVGISLDDNTVTTHGMLTSSSSTYGPPKSLYAADGRLFWQTYYNDTQGIGGLQVTDCVSAPSDENTTFCGVDILDTYSGNYNYPPAYTPVINHPMLCYVSFNGVVTNTPEYFLYMAHYLATVNNLATPIVKAPTQTMKITYTIQEV